MYNNIKIKSISLNSNLCEFSNNTYSITATNKFLPISTGKETAHYSKFFSDPSTKRQPPPR